MHYIFGGSRNFDNSSKIVYTIYVYIAHGTDPISFILFTERVSDSFITRARHKKK